MITKILMTLETLIFKTMQGMHFRKLGLFDWHFVSGFLFLKNKHINTNITRSFLPLKTFFQIVKTKLKFENKNK